MWLIYVECGTCGVAAKQPCVGQRFGPHEGRQTRWEKDREVFEELTARVRDAVAEGRAGYEARGYEGSDAGARRGRWREVAG